MRPRNALILTGAAAALVLAAVLVERLIPSTDVRTLDETSAFPLLRGRTDLVDAIELTRAGGKTVLVRERGPSGLPAWYITQPLSSRADFTGVVQFLGAFERAGRFPVAEDGAFEMRLGADADLARYGLDHETHVHVRLHAGGTVLVDALVGSKTAQADAVYVAPASRDRLMVVADDVYDQARTPPERLRDRRLLDLRGWKVTALRTFARRRGADGAGAREELLYDLVRGDDGRVRLLGPVADEADPAEAERLLERVRDLTAEAVKEDLDPADSATAGKLADMELAPPNWRIEIEAELSSERAAREIRLGKAVPKTVSGKPAVSVLATAKGTGTVHYLPSEALDAIHVSAESLRDPILARFEAPRARSVRLERAAGRLALVRPGDSWEVAAPSKGPADAGAVGALLGELGRLQAKGFAKDAWPAAGAGAQLVEAFVGLAPPEDAAGGAARELAISLAFVGGGADGTGARLLGRRKGRDAVLELEPAVVSAVLWDALRFRDRTVLSFDATKALRLAITADGRAEEAAYDPRFGAWRSEVRGFSAGRADFLRGMLSSFAAQEYVAPVDGEGDLERHGLASPHVRIEVERAIDGPGGTAKAALVVGSLRRGAAEAPPARYATVEGEAAGAGLVFLVPAEAAAALRAGFSGSLAAP